MYDNDVNDSLLSPAVWGFFVLRHFKKYTFNAGYIK